MFQVKGWGTLSKDLELMNKSLRDDAFTSCTTNEEWQYRRGQLDILDYLCGYQSQMESAYTALSDPQ